MGERLQGKVAVITGGSSGMGRASVLRFLAEGACVVFGDMNEETAGETLALAGQAGNPDNVAFLHTDVAEEADIVELMQTAQNKFGRIDCVFNNAGIGGAIGRITDISVEDWDFTFAVLVRSVFLGIKHGARIMIEQGDGGAIINTASIAGVGGGGGPICYSAAKSSLINLTKNAGSDLAEHRIRVNAIAPGIIFTPLFHRGRPDDIPQAMLDKQPWPDHGEPEDIANLALFLASDEARFISGETVVCDGALTAAGPSIYGIGEKALFAGRIGVNMGSTGRDNIRR